ncbi:LysM peptidoglycan-binding domain-containing protein [Paenibacillus pasadenensis]|uniref:LysM peptidoglycan-binding domain-containing protein n=1 Tax=Paenibacillus pasadenensis TaxID=217090 RepID=UPI0020423060|nr:LysM peptidoglycan-binding domain-containing protein [Paenibacillus pasadenensis]MCM3748029.1 LysM peptidoglycan-binding domain-containing protein [Paenibacillus pasadenensis]
MATSTKPQPAAVVPSFAIRLEFNSGAEGWELPVLPEKLSIRRSGAGKSYSIIGAGNISTIEKPELAEIDFESFFPVHPKLFNEQAGSKTPAEYVADINRWMKSGYPIRFIYGGSGEDGRRGAIRLPMTITSFERWEQAGSPGDVYFSLKLKEYVFYAPVKIRVAGKDGKMVAEPAKRADLRVPPKTYKVVKGDTLIRISMKLYDGDSGRWREIQKLNGLSDADLKRLQIGQLLKVPPPKE